jgi:hypothetical protein
MFLDEQKVQKVRDAKKRLEAEATKKAEIERLEKLRQDEENKSEYLINKLFI